MFTLLFFISLGLLVALIVGLVEPFPYWPMSKTQPTRKRLGMTFGGLFLICVILLVLSAQSWGKTDHTVKVNTVAQVAKTKKSNKITSAPTNTPTDKQVPTLTDYQQAQQDIADMDAKSKVVTVSNFDKNPYSYMQKDIKVLGNITSFVHNNDGTTDINVTDPNDPTVSIVVQATNFTDLSQINKGDSITIYGKSGGTISGTNGFGAPITKGLIYELFLVDNTNGYIQN